MKRTVIKFKTQWLCRRLPTVEYNKKMKNVFEQFIETTWWRDGDIAIYIKGGEYGRYKI